MPGLNNFTNDLMISYQNQNFFNKCVIGAVVTHVAIRCTWDISKLFFGAVGTSVLTKIRSKFRQVSNAKDPKFKDGVFYLHMFPRSITKQVPNLSPFAIKVETFFRANNVPHEVVETLKFSSTTGQIPYLFHNGKEISDSNFILDYVMSSIGLTEDCLSHEQAGLSRAITMMVEENTSTTIFLQRYVYEFKKFLRIFQLPMIWPIKKIVERTFPNGFSQRAHMVGMGRKTRQQVFEIAEKDIKAISDILGDKDYLLGNKIQRVDCAVFGMFSQVVFVDFHFPQMDYIKSECPNLLKYMHRIKENYWKDWETIVAPGHFF